MAFLLLHNYTDFIKIKSSSTIIFCEQDKSIFDRYKIFKVLKVDGLEFSDNIPIFTLDKGNTYQFILESVSNCSGMKKIEAIPCI